MRILIVDDEPFICELLSEFLKSYGEVETLVDGSLALAKLEEARTEEKPFSL
ncbi:response regulator, partial [bacterium]|nr:response regulator [bacterium]